MKQLLSEWIKAEYMPNSKGKWPDPRTIKSRVDKGILDITIVREGKTDYVVVAEPENIENNPILRAYDAA